MDIKVHEDYEQINKENIEVFEKTGLKRSEENGFRCIICGEPACIDNSMSYSGHRLIHTVCVRRIFGSGIGGMSKAFEWMNKGD